MLVQKIERQPRRNQSVDHVTDGMNPLIVARMFQDAVIAGIGQFLIPGERPSYWRSPVVLQLQRRGLAVTLEHQWMALGHIEPSAGSQEIGNYPCPAEHVVEPIYRTPGNVSYVKRP